MKIFLHLRLSYLRINNFRVTLVHLRFLSWICHYSKSAAAPCSSQPSPRCCPSQLGVHRQISAALVLPWFPPQQMGINSFLVNRSLHRKEERWAMNVVLCSPECLSRSSVTAAEQVPERERERRVHGQRHLKCQQELHFTPWKWNFLLKLSISRALETSGFLLRKQSFLCLQTWSESTKNRNCQFKNGWESIPLHLHRRQNTASNSEMF